MKLYKFFKDDCYPCRTVTAILKRVNVPEDIELVEVNVTLDENKPLVEERGIMKVPVLMFEDGRRLDGMKPIIVVEKFLKGEQI